VTDDVDDTVIVPRRPLPTSPDVSSPSTGSDDELTVIASKPSRRIDHATGEFMDAESAAWSAAVAHETEPQETEEIPPLTYYAFRIGERGEAILLDAPCYVGRNPSPPRVVRGLPPRLVRVSSELREVSATHLEVRQLGSSVVVTDLRSTNGSIVTVPGGLPTKLRQGESVVVSPGTLVDIGEGTILQILPMQRPA
jgi:hypothetical protein